MTPKQIATYAVVAILAWKAGIPLIRFAVGLLTGGLATVFGSSGGATADPTSLRAAMRNVTTDYDQLTVLVQDFFRQTSQLRQDNSSEVLFREFLELRATKSRPSLEQGLDWILALYKIIWPVLVVFLISKLNSGKSQPEEDVPLQREGSHRAHTSDVTNMPNGDHFTPDPDLRQHRSYPSHPRRTSSSSKPSAPLASHQSAL